MVQFAWNAIERTQAWSVSLMHIVTILLAEYLIFQENPFSLIHAQSFCSFRFHSY